MQTPNGSYSLHEKNVSGHIGLNTITKTPDASVSNKRCNASTVPHRRTWSSRAALSLQATWVRVGLLRQSRALFRESCLCWCWVDGATLGHAAGESLRFSPFSMGVRQDIGEVCMQKNLTTRIRAGGCHDDSLCQNKLYYGINSSICVVQYESRSDKLNTRVYVYR